MRLLSADVLALFSQILKTAVKNKSYSPICLELAKHSRSLAWAQKRVIPDVATGVQIRKGKGILDQTTLFNFILASGEEGSRV